LINKYIPSIYIFIFFFYISFPDFETRFRQSIEADLGRVVAKVSSQINPSSSVKITEKKKEKKKEKKTSQEEPSDQRDNSTQDTPVEMFNAEKPRDKKKKKKKLKKTYSASTTTIPEVSTLNEQLGRPQDAINEKPQDPPQHQNSNPNNESSNSCLQPPPIKVIPKFLFSI
jgi:aconitase A